MRNEYSQHFYEQATAYARYAYTESRTPELCALAEEGFRFIHSFVAVCPSTNVLEKPRLFSDPGYLLICVVLYPRSFVRCACVICHIVGDLYTRVLRGRNRKQPFHSSKTNMKTKQNQRKQTSRWCSIRTNDCALLFGFSVQWLVEWRTSINALHNFQLERFFGSSHSCSLQSKSTYWPHCIRSGFYSVSWIGQCLCWSLNKCAQSTFSRTSSDRAPFYSQTHQTSASTENHYSFSKSCEVISSGTLRSKIDSFQIDYFRTENSNYFRSFSAFNSFLEFSSRHDRRNTIDYTLLIIKKNR